MIIFNNLFSKITKKVNKLLISLLIMMTPTALTLVRGEKKTSKVTLSMKTEGKKEFEIKSSQDDTSNDEGNDGNLGGDGEDKENDTKIADLGYSFNNIALEVSLVDQFKLDVNLNNLLLDKWLLDWKKMKEIALKDEVEGKVSYTNQSSKILSYALIGFSQAIKDLYIIIPVPKGTLHLGQMKGKAGVGFNYKEHDSLKFYIGMGNTLEKIMKNLLAVVCFKVKVENTYGSFDLEVAANTLTNKETYHDNPLDAWGPAYFNKFIIPTLKLGISKGVLELINVYSVVKDITLSYTGHDQSYSYAKGEFKEKPSEIGAVMKFHPIKVTDNFSLEIKPKVTRKYIGSTGAYKSNTKIELPIDLKLKNFTFTITLGANLEGLSLKSSLLNFVINMKHDLWVEENEE